MRIVLRHEKKLYVLEQLPPPPLPENATRAEKDAHRKHQDDVTDVACLILAIMSSELQKQHELMTAYDMIIHLKQLCEG